MAKREGTLIGFLQPSKGNLWKLLYGTMNSTIQLCWKYAHHYSDQHSLTNAEYYTWEKFADDLTHLNLDEVPWTVPVDFDPRFSYNSMDLTDQLSREDLRETAETQEYAKCGPYGLNDLPTLEVRIIPEDLQLGFRGRKRGADEDITTPLKRERRARNEALQYLRALILQKPELRRRRRKNESPKERVPLKEPQNPPVNRHMKRERKSFLLTMWRQLQRQTPR